MRQGRIVMCRISCVSVRQCAPALEDLNTGFKVVAAPVRGTLAFIKTESRWRPDQFMLSCNQPVPNEIYWPVIRELLQSMVEKPKRPSRQEEFEFSPYFQPLLFDDDVEEA